MPRERYHEQKRGAAASTSTCEQFNRQTRRRSHLRTASASTKPYRKLVAIRSPQNLFMLEKALAETDPGHDRRGGDDGQGRCRPATAQEPAAISTHYDQQLMTAVVERAEKAGKQVKPLIVPTNNPLFAVVRHGQDLRKRRN